MGSGLFCFCSVLFLGVLGRYACCLPVYRIGWTPEAISMASGRIRRPSSLHDGDVDFDDHERLGSWSTSSLNRKGLLC